MPLAIKEIYKSKFSYFYTNFLISCSIHIILFVFIMYIFAKKNIEIKNSNSISLSFKIKESENNFSSQKIMKEKKLFSKKMISHNIAKKNDTNKVVNDNNQSSAEKLIDTNQKNLQPSEGKEYTNPFGFLKIPSVVLGQKLFPRKYRLGIVFTLESSRFTSVIVQDFYSMQENTEYLDKLILKAFERQISEISNESLLLWVNHINNGPIDLNLNKHIIRNIVLEFKE